MNKFFKYFNLFIVIANLILALLFIVAFIKFGIFTDLLRVVFHIMGAIFMHMLYKDIVRR